MAQHLNKGLSFQNWPEPDRLAFEKLVATNDLFSDGKWSHLSEASIRKRRYGYGKWIGFMRNHAPQSLSKPPAERVTLAHIQVYVAALRRNCTENSVAIAIQELRLTVCAMAPEDDWRWLYEIERRVANRAVPLSKPHVLSSELYQIGTEMMDNAKSHALHHGRPVLRHAELYRDGLMIAVLAEAPMRRAGFAGLRIGRSVINVAGTWRIYLSPEMVKTRSAQDYELSKHLGDYVDGYMRTFRPVFPNADGHDAMWPFGERAMADKMIRRYIRKHTEARLGYAVSPHSFREAAATLISTADPAEVLSARDLLGHQSFAMTEKHYVHGARSRLAANVLSDAFAKRLSSSRRQCGS